MAQRDYAQPKMSAAWLGKELKIVFLLAAAVLLIIAGSSQMPKPFASSELQFTDASARGLSIVPASCDSNPPYEHASGECDVAVSNNCTLSAGSGTIAPGQSTTLQWNVSQPGVAAFFPSSFSGNISPAVGAISNWSGSTLVNPSLTTTYVLNGTISVSLPWFGSVRTGSAQCQTTVTVQAACVPENVCTGGNVVNSCTGATVATCTLGCSGGQCICPAGMLAYNGSCVASCPAGFAAFNGVCVQPCPIGYVATGGVCVFNACPAGYAKQGDLCVSTATCTPLNYCVGTTLWHRDAACSTNPVQACSNGCSAGGCIGVASPGVVVWQVRPPLLSAGETANVSWQVTDVRSCEVRGNNGDAWSGASGAQITSPITAQTTYTLSCIGLDNSIVTRTAIVNVIPIFEEL